MERIKDRIEELTQKLKKEKESLKISYDSVKEHWNSFYHRSLEDKCKMMFKLVQGLEYKPYTFSEKFVIKISENWNTKEHLDYCNIYDEGFGNPVGFISLPSGLFDATKEHHKAMWLNAIKEDKEERGFENYSAQLKEDLQFLINSFNSYCTERGTGAYSTRDYLIEFEEKRLKTGKFYIYLKGTSHKLTFYK